MIQSHGVSQRQACKAVHLSSSTKRYQKRTGKDGPVITSLQGLVEKFPAIGFWQCYYRIRRSGFVWNHKRVYRIYTLLKLNLRRRARRRLPARVKQALFKPAGINEVWSVDFMADSLWNGRKFRLLNIVDDYNREVLQIETDTSLPTLRLIRCLEMLESIRGLPKMIRVDNGPEFISAQLDEWCRNKKITLVFIQPGKPMQNGYVERCNGNIRRELLNAYLFQTLDEVREKAEEWRLDYNENRPHASLGYVPPAEYNIS
jgi:putative transposase